MPAVCYPVAVCGCSRSCAACLQRKQHTALSPIGHRRRIFYRKLHSRPSYYRLSPLPELRSHLDFTISLRPTMHCVLAPRATGTDHKELDCIIIILYYIIYKCCCFYKVIISKKKKEKVNTGPRSSCRKVKGGQRGKTGVPSINSQPPSTVTQWLQP